MTENKCNHIQKMSRKAGDCLHLAAKNLNSLETNRRKKWFRIMHQLLDQVKVNNIRCQYVWCRGPLLCDTHGNQKTFSWENNN